jgi:hypothetical protein
MPAQMSALELRSHRMSRMTSFQALLSSFANFHVCFRDQLHWPAMTGMDANRSSLLGGCTAC